MDATRAAHIAAARVAFRHLEGWTSVHDSAGGPLRPSGLIYALCVAEDAFILEMLVLGWGVGPAMNWGLIDGWTLAAALGAAADRTSTRLHSSHYCASRLPSYALTKKQ